MRLARLLSQIVAGDKTEMILPCQATYFITSLLFMLSTILPPQIKSYLLFWAISVRYVCRLLTKNHMKWLLLLYPTQTRTTFAKCCLFFIPFNAQIFIFQYSFHSRAGAAIVFCKYLLAETLSICLDGQNISMCLRSLSSKVAHYSQKAGRQNFMCFKLHNKTAGLRRRSVSSKL